MECSSVAAIGDGPRLAAMAGIRSMQNGVSNGPGNQGRVMVERSTPDHGASEINGRVERTCD